MRIVFIEVSLGHEEIAYSKAYLQDGKLDKRNFEYTEDCLVLLFFFQKVAYQVLFAGKSMTGRTILGNVCWTQAPDKT